MKGKQKDPPIFNQNIEFDRIIEKFHNGKERYLKNPLLHTVVHELYNGNDPVKIIDSLLIIIESQQGQLKEVHEQGFIKNVITIDEGSFKNPKDFTDIIEKMSGK